MSTQHSDSRKPATPGHTFLMAVFAVFGLSAMGLAVGLMGAWMNVIKDVYGG
jgi:hypothetical protein